MEETQGQGRDAEKLQRLQTSHARFLHDDEEVGEENVGL